MTETLDSDDRPTAGQSHQLLLHRDQESSQSDGSSSPGIELDEIPRSRLVIAFGSVLIYFARRLTSALESRRLHLSLGWNKALKVKVSRFAPA